MPRHRIIWSIPAPPADAARASQPAGRLVAIEPGADDVARHADALADAYNDPRNAPLLGHTERLTPGDVIAHYASVADDGGTNFLVLRDGALVGDADLRHVAGGAAEIALMVASPAAQGQGLGTRIATMITAFAFTRLGLSRVYASIIPANAASLRVFTRLGYTVDASPAARAYADEPGDVVLAIDHAMFTRGHAAALAEIVITSD